MLFHTVSCVASTDDAALISSVLSTRSVCQRREDLGRTRRAGPAVAARPRGSRRHLLFDDVMGSDPWAEVWRIAGAAGCNLAAVESAGHQSEFDLIGACATANVYGAVIYVPEAAIGTLDLVTVDNSSPEDGGLDPEVVLELTS